MSYAVHAGSDLDPSDRELVRAARAAMANAYAPYSGFNVGAALRLGSGIIVTGSNQENASFPNGLCAERVAMFAAASSHPEMAFEALAIVTGADDPVTPCGICRQTMFEYTQRFRKKFKLILMDKNDRVMVFDDAAELLPIGFSSRHLKSDRKQGTSNK